MCIFTIRVQYVDVMYLSSGVSRSSPVRVRARTQAMPYTDKPCGATAQHHNAATCSGVPCQQIASRDSMTGYSKQDERPSEEHHEGEDVVSRAKLLQETTMAQPRLRQSVGFCNDVDISAHVPAHSNSCRIPRTHTHTHTHTRTHARTNNTHTHTVRTSPRIACVH